MERVVRRWQGWAISRQDGRWCDPDTWEGGRVPTSGKVYITHNVWRW